MTMWKLKLLKFEHLTDYYRIKHSKPSLYTSKQKHWREKEHALNVNISANVNLKISFNFPLFYFNVKVLPVIIHFYQSHVTIDWKI